MTKFEDVQNESTEEYFKGNRFSIDAFNKKYAIIQDETYVKAIKRVCDYIASVEDTKEKQKYWSARWFDEIYNDWWQPAGSIMQGTGNPNKVSLANCTTTSLGKLDNDTEWDSLEGIIKNTTYSIAKSAAYRQGVGVDFSRIRPVGTKVLNSSNKSSGVIHWMKLIDSIGYFVGQSGRIPAMLISLSCDHPDIEEFIKVKSDYSQLQNVNISVQCTNEFYAAVLEDNDWDLSFEIPSVKIGDKVYIDVHSTTMDSIKEEETGRYYYIAKRNRPHEKITKTVKARYILELIAKNMCAHGEPGIQNIDIAKKYSNSDYVYNSKDEYDSRIISTNACCVVGETSVLTDRGWLTIKEIFDIYLSRGTQNLQAMSYNTLENKFEFKPILNAWQQRNDKTVSVYWGNNTGDSWYSLECSSDHKILTAKGYVEAGKLTGKDLITCLNPEIRTQFLMTTGKEIKPLYDIEVQDNHNFVVNNGIVIKNSEQYLSRDGLCILSSINCEKFSDNKEQYSKELEIIGESIFRFLDNVNECELRYAHYSTPIQAISIRKLRRVGAGIINIAGWLFKCGEAYGTEKGNELIEEFMKTYNYYLYKTSIAVGEEKGSFELFDEKKYCKSPFVKRMMELGLQFKTMRSVCCSSIAPGGTLATQIRDTILSYGIEPAFNIYYWKRTRMEGKYTYYFCVPHIIRETFSKAGLEIPMDSDTIKDTFDGTNGKPIVKFIEENIKKIKTNFRRASEVAPLEKLDLMSRVMKWVDSSISVTYELPEKTDWKDIYNFILEAYKREVKSIAAFPAKNMYGIVSYIPFRDLASKLIAEGTTIHPQNFSEDEYRDVYGKHTCRDCRIPKTHAPKRPITLESDVWHVTIRGHRYYVVTGLMEGECYEVFAGSNHDNDGEIIISKAIDRGVVKKIKRGHYNLIANGKEYVLTNGHTDPNVDALTRMISTSLRHGADVSFVVAQLEKTRGDLQSFAKCLSRVLKKYIKDNTPVTGDKCANCGSENLVRLEGCISCADCGSSKCS